MGDPLNVLVTTLYCGEDDFYMCQKMIASQRGIIIVHEVIDHKPEREAHNALLQSWNACLMQYDVLVKIDADTVLRSCDIIHKTATLLLSSGAAASQSPLHDFYTDSPINGLNMYVPSKNVFRATDNKLHCDRSIEHLGRVVYGNEMDESINPAGLHCFYSAPEQAYRYGVHRGLKNQTDVFNRVKRAHEKVPDRNRALAIEGFNDAATFRMNGLGFNYCDDDFKRMYAAAAVRVSA